MSDWHLSDGPERPLWEPVRLVDFDGDRLEALKKLREKLRSQPLEELNDEDLGMHAILEYLFTNATVRLDTAKAEIVRLATMRLPKPASKGNRRRLPPARRDDMVLIAGRMWSIFISHNFPLNHPHMWKDEPEA